MTSRKRGRAEMESPGLPLDTGLLEKLRNMWEFSNLMQYIFIFGKAVKIDEDLTIEDLESECIKPEPSETLSDIGLALLKFVSSHRGLTPGIFDEYTRRQYVAKAPSRNPFGTEEIPKKFADFDIFTKFRVLFQLSQWTLINADRIREKMPETKDSEQTQWRIEEIGYDRQQRLYFVLDDNRMYRRTDPQLPPPPAAKPKASSKRGKAAARASKRRKVVDTEESNNDADEDIAGGTSKAVLNGDEGFGGRKWECIAITLGQYHDFLQTIRKSKDIDETALHQRITREVLPVIEKAEEAHQRRAARKERELMNEQKLATAKRSSRIATKMDKEREEQEAAEAELKRKNDLVEAKQQRERQKNMEEARESRMMTREQRIKEREYKRILQVEELANLSEDSKKLETGEARMSERHLKAEMERKKRELAELAQEDEWSFDCSKCGVHGENLDDGTHSVACEKCNVWQHSACLGISQAAAERDNFHFICDDCKRREEDAKKPKIPTLKFHLGSSSSPPSQKPNHVNGDSMESKKRHLGDEAISLPPLKKFKPVEVKPTDEQPHLGQNGMHSMIMHGPTLSPEGQLPMPPHRGNSTAHVASPPPPPPPGLRSPAQPATYSNSYTQHVPYQNGYSSEIRPQSSHSFSPTPNGVSQNSNNPSGRGWSARYQSSHPSQHLQHIQSPSPSQDPFQTSLSRQMPDPSIPSQNLPSPIKNRPSMSPTQGDYDTSPLNFPPAQNTNGTSLQHPLPNHDPSNSPIKQQSSPLAPSVLPPSASPILQAPPQQWSPISPVKQQSSPLAPSIPPTSTSPSLHGLAQHQSPIPPASGLSPTKHSPPRPPPSHGVMGTPVMPPTTNLSPSPTLQNFNAPVKGLTLEQGAAVNGEKPQI